MRLYVVVSEPMDLPEDNGDYVSRVEGIFTDKETAESLKHSLAPKGRYAYVTECVSGYVAVQE